MNKKYFDQKKILVKLLTERTYRVTDKPQLKFCYPILYILTIKILLQI